jgi:hypothetical protein
LETHHRPFHLLRICRRRSITSLPKTMCRAEVLSHPPPSSFSVYSALSHFFVYLPSLSEFGFLRTSFIFYYRCPFATLLFCF